MKRVRFFMLSVLVFLLLRPCPTVYGDEIIRGRDAQGRRTETDNNGTWGKTVTTYDSETGFEVYRQWFSSEGTLLKETFTNLQTGEVRQISYYDFATYKTGRWETTEIDQRVLDAMQRRKGALERLKEKPPQDEWDFLPDFVPGVSVYENLPENKLNAPAASQIPDQPSAPQVLDQPRKKVFGSFGNSNQKSQDSTSVQDSNPKANPSQNGGEMPLADPEPLTGDSQDSAPKVPDKGPDFSNFFGSFNEPEPKEIDQNQYGDQVVFDPQTSQTSVINSSTGAITTFHVQRGYFSNAGGGTQAVTTLNGQLVHEDHYDRLGNLTSSTSVDPRMGIRTITDFHRDGTQTVRRTDADGRPLLQKASATDPNTGVTTTAQGNADGTKTVTKTDKDGNVIDQTTRGRSDSNVMIEGSATDPKTGITRTGKKLKDGTTQITITDKNGKVIGTEKRDASGKLMSQAQGADHFSQFDAMSGNPMGQLASTSFTPTAGLDGVQSRSLAFGAGVIGGSTQSDSSPKAECEHS
ncbi:MAG: hypothetical protein HY351_04240 [Candidatus Omnitrophica bacterium]|nr:hypothetical protein [Candidatus Omnitrophota bacterium]